MDGFLDRDASTPAPEQLGPSSLSAEELGESLAHLVWESFTDELTDPELLALLTDLGLELHDGVPDQHVVEELLILTLWAHTRTVQLAYHQRASGDWTRTALDALHRAVFEDLAGQGTPPSQLALFEQRVGARYAEYNQAAEASDERVGEVAARHLLAGRDETPVEAARFLTARTVSVSGPLRDYLQEVEPEE